MATDKFDYARLLNDIDTKMAALQTLRASVLVASASGALGGGQSIDGSESPSQALENGRNDTLGGVPTELPEGAFNGKSVPTCIELYLSAAKKKKTNKEIAAALREGGVESNASNFDNTVTGALFKLKHDGKILRFKDGWGLSSWYPAHIRAVPAGTTKRTKKKSKKAGRKNAADKSNTAASTATVESLPSKGKASDRIMDLLRTKPEREYPLEEIAERTVLGVKFSRLTLGKLLKAGKVRMSAPGTYTTARPQLVAAQ